MHKIEEGMGKISHCWQGKEYRGYGSDPKLFWHGSRLGSLDPKVYLAYKKSSTIFLLFVKKFTENF